MDLKRTTTKIASAKHKKKKKVLTPVDFEPLPQHSVTVKRTIFICKPLGHPFSLIKEIQRHVIQGIHKYHADGLSP